MEDPSTEENSRVLTVDSSLTKTTAVHIFLNPRSGPDSKTQEEIAEAFARFSLRPAITQLQQGMDVGEAVSRAIQEGCGIVVAGGGDGTINAVASALMGTDCALGVLPLGTLNHFAKDLKIPVDLDGAIAVIAAQHSVLVDVADVNGHVYLNNSSLGLYPAVVSERERLQHSGLGKWLAFGVAAAKALYSFPKFTVRLVAEGEKRTVTTSFLFIGNNEYDVEGFNLGSRKSLRGGELAVYRARNMGRVGYLKIAIWAALGKLNESDGLEMLKVTELSIESRRKRVRVSLDGEVTRLTSPLDYKIRPRSLKVLVPAAE